MLDKIKRRLLAAQTRIVICTGVGVFFVANSFKRSGSSSIGRGAPSSWGASVDPFMLAIGVVLLVLAWLIYKKWSSDKT
ncbi:MAG: hypothetical protein KJ550_08140 [Proteobacteria bacterium]|nr:hypothetical protein [Desulfobacteraceae bacterium]MBU4013421.1 hypothetical protein [Pseudomonadota bacterium]MBU4068565.1 hypothetical protein [Pseudomonadota bacterium]MBU4100776.1 hypothetical protein [Pseudomonadota bacterium]MBU4127202.1 hypothetical protein [Pseudomonadota bacterium]